jgi:eukaryotic-like serine/threonine-protein kinase
VLTGRNQAAERLRLLLEANGIRQEVAKTDPDLPEDRLHMARSYCMLSDAELAMNNLAKAREYADRAVPLLQEFNLSSPSLLILRDLGYGYKILGEVQSRRAADRSVSAADRRSAAAASRDWYAKSASVWSEWNRRGGETPESEAERRAVEQLLKAR